MVHYFQWRLAVQVSSDLVPVQSHRCRRLCCSCRAGLRQPAPRAESATSRPGAARYTAYSQSYLTLTPLLAQACCSVGRASCCAPKRAESGIALTRGDQACIAGLNCLNSLQTEQKEAHSYKAHTENASCPCQVLRTCPSPAAFILPTGLQKQATSGTLCSRTAAVRNSLAVAGA